MFASVIGLGRSVGFVGAVCALAIGCAGEAADDAAPACDSAACSAAEASPEPASVLGTLPANPPSRSLEGMHLTGQIFSGDSALNWDVLLGASDTSSAAIARTITAGTGGSVVATDEGGFIRLTTLGAGDGVYLYAFSTGAGAVLGFSEDVVGTGAAQ